MDKKIPIVFAFNDTYALPAWAAIKSLLDNAGDAQYQMYVLYSSLKNKVFKKFNQLVAQYPGQKLDWIEMDRKIFAGFPTHSVWTQEVYYRLVIQDVLPQHDKIIWSDVDVFFKANLKEIFETDMGDCMWGGIKAEINDKNIVMHNYIEENHNSHIYMPGFMLVNTKLMRENNMTQVFFDAINKFRDKLVYFDLDILNLTCQNIYPIPFEYCVLENVYYADKLTDTKEYPWLVKVWTHEELENARQNAVIIHYAGGDIKVWRRAVKDMPEHYRPYYLNSPFKIKCRWLVRLGYYLMMKISPTKAMRRNWRHELRKL